MSYIEREALRDALYEADAITMKGVAIINQFPAADVAPVVHGRWIVSEYEYLDCSVCGEAMYTGCNSTKEAKLLKDHWKRYCPNCGAKMDGESEDSKWHLTNIRPTRSGQAPRDMTVF